MEPINDDRGPRHRRCCATTSTPTRSSPSSSSSASSARASASSCSTTGPRSRAGTCPATRSSSPGATSAAARSREHAPWALEDYGFKAIIAPSFADIFRSNCTKIGLLPVELPEADVAAIAEAGEAEVDLDAQEVRWPGGSASFDIDPEIKHRLLNGLDDIGLTLQQERRDRRLRARPRAPGPGHDGAL